VVFFVNKIWLNGSAIPVAISISTRKKGGSSVRYIYKDTSASNYGYSRFGRHKQSKCEFDTVEQGVSETALVVTDKVTEIATEDTIAKDACTIPFTQYVEKNYYGPEVLAIQKFLNTYENANFLENSIYGNETPAAIKNFQPRYYDDVLKPWNLTSATGLWYQSTRKKANFLRGCPEGIIVLDNRVALA
jgi:hypothetical protein